VLGGDVYTFNNYTAFIDDHFQNFAGLFQVLVITGNHYNSVAFLDVEFGFKSVTHCYMLKAGC
jgi:hypothetical protein